MKRFAVYLYVEKQNRKLRIVMMTEKEKRDILKKVLSDEYTDEQMKAYAELEAVDKEMRKQWESGEGEYVDWKLKKQIWKKVLAQCADKPARKIRSVWFWRVAVVFLFLAGGIGWMLNQRLQEDKYIQIMAAENMEYILPDSSRVWLQAGSSIKYAKAFKEDRKVWQKGNALFEVRRQQGNVFRVYVREAFIEVKGTCFEVRQIDSLHDEVSLFNGAVDFNTGREKISIRPMQKLLYNTRKNRIEKVGGVHNINWEQDRFVFTNILLSELIDFINSFYKTHIIIGENVNGADFFTGGIRYTESLDEVLNKLEYVVNLKIRRQEKQITIYK